LQAKKDQTGQDSEWLLIDPERKDRLRHDGETILPGSGTRWSHVHRDGANSDSTQLQENAQGDDDLELPWTIVGIMGEDMLNNLRNHHRHFNEEVRRAKLGHDLPQIHGPGSAEDGPPEGIGKVPEAEDAFHSGKYSKAAELYATALADEAVKATPNNWAKAVLHMSKAACHRRQREFDLASAELGRATNLYPRYKKGIFERAMLHLDKGDSHKALQDLQRLLGLDREWPQISDWLVRASISVMRGEKVIADEDNNVDLPKEETAECVAWRQTGMCNPDGPRESSADKGCGKVVDRGDSGYCECKFFDFLKDEIAFAPHFAELRIQLRTSAKSCHAEPFACNAVCKREWVRIVQASVNLEAKLTTEGLGIEAAQLLSARIASEKAYATEKQAISAKQGSIECNGSMMMVGNKFVCKEPAKEEKRRRSWDNYYVLGISRDFTPEELKRGYRRKSIETHPDKHKGSNDAFEQVGTAYNILKDAAQRLQYDEGLDMKKAWTTESHEPKPPAEDVVRRYFPERFDFQPFGADYTKERTKHMEEIKDRLKHAESPPPASEDGEPSDDGSDAPPEPEPEDDEVLPPHEDSQDDPDGTNPHVPLESHDEV